MLLLDTMKSKLDKTVKYVFQLDGGLITEVSYINKDDGKDILCVATQTGCGLGCRFCFMTDTIGKIRVLPISGQEIADMVSAVHRDLNLAQNQRMLLISYMGCGEPLCNLSGVLGSMHLLERKYKPIRFAIATLIPSYLWGDFFYLTNQVQIYKFNLKLHLSLHFTDDAIRKEWMPNALPIGPAIAALEFYRKLTGNSVELHYALIDGVNDRHVDVWSLGELLRNRDIPVKLLYYNEREVISEKRSGDHTVELFMEELDAQGVKNEYYVPPGLSVGASCGQFLMDYYLKYNIKKEQ